MITKLGQVTWSPLCWPETKPRRLTPTLADRPKRWLNLTRRSKPHARSCYEACVQMTDLLTFTHGCRFSLMYVDPPWRFEVYNRATGLHKSPDRHYRTMKTEDIAAMPVGEIAAKDSLLVMWVYDPKMPDALTVASAWGFKFVTPLFRWLKTTKNGKLGFGTGYHTRGGGCEEAWLFKRGRGLPVLRHNIRKEFYSPLRDHSRKPDEVRGWIVDLYGEQPRIELFARHRAKGWSSWGMNLR